MAYRDSTATTGYASSGDVAVPSGAAVDDIAIILAQWDGNTGETFTWPSGFTQLYRSVQSGPETALVGLAWKRLTAADSGTYTVSMSGSAFDYTILCALFSGRHTTDPPVATEVINTTSNTSPVDVTATGVTAVDGDDLLWGAAGDATVLAAGSGFTAPASFTEREDATPDTWSDAAIATRDNVSAGATGDVTGVFTLASGFAGYTAYLVRIPASGGAAPTNTGDGNFPFRSGWLRRSRERGSGRWSVLYKTPLPGASDDADVTVFNDWFFDEASGGVSNISGVASVAFSGSATLSATGALAGSATAAFSTSATLGGVAALSGSTTVTFTTSGTLEQAGSGAMSGAATVAFTTSAVLSGSAALAGSSSAQFTSAATLTATAALSGAAASAFTTAANLSGSAALSGASTVAFATSGVANASAALSGSSVSAFGAVATLTATADLSGHIALTFTTVGTMTAEIVIEPPVVSGGGGGGAMSIGRRKAGSGIWTRIDRDHEIHRLVARSIVAGTPRIVAPSGACCVRGAATGVIAGMPVVALPKGRAVDDNEVLRLLELLEAA